ncbi:hypothetical protein SUGI_0081230 [Cryptomeria japonica]|nr:hypothetical protein SUGI_0081230 [Cryptomeria japonica]
MFNFHYNNNNAVVGCETSKAGALTGAKEVAGVPGEADGGDADVDDDNDHASAFLGQHRDYVWCGWLGEALAQGSLWWSAGFVRFFPVLSVEGLSSPTLVGSPFVEAPFFLQILPSLSILVHELGGWMMFGVLFSAPFLHLGSVVSLLRLGPSAMFWVLCSL